MTHHRSDRFKRHTPTTHMKDLGTALGGYPVYHEGGLELLCNARSEQEVLSALRIILGIPLSRDRLRPEKLTAEELAELAVQHRG